MGWDVTQVGRNITTKKYVVHYLKTMYDDSYEVVKIVEGKNNYGEKAFYVAAKKKGDDKVFAVVFLTRRKNGFISIKVIGESSGPGQTEAPANFLNLLSPTDSIWANQWRAECLKQHITNLIAKESA
jgi:hypothetical protein